MMFKLGRLGGLALRTKVIRMVSTLPLNFISLVPEVDGADLNYFGQMVLLNKS